MRYIYRVLRNIPKASGQHPVIKHITVSSVKRMNIHTKFLNKDYKQHYNLFIVYVYTVVMNW